MLGQSCNVEPFNPPHQEIDRSLALAIILMHRTRE